jgi:hypothetical protein
VAVWSLRAGMPRPAQSAGQDSVQTGAESKCCCQKGNHPAGYSGLSLAPDSRLSPAATAVESSVGDERRAADLAYTGARYTRLDLRSLAKTAKSILS